ncbi:SMP-30/gluconolactonase/LRE family protein [Cyclobacterium amurskyense]|uniref:SMP-30/Gluconolaconase/LRE domain protein n=1 Tax=Cyclobacterium amurskyense TaxID=320787 RepID=A0A0H4PC15_9BACT|nr:SMP-30/gluconolactonase/LRE family protein [Cyclobacterium amurskyense]AKP51804.1 SMP-30/Gluconolaconase/LRE domain protein [Cyclobacterium amurskyense]|tara:strand:+ start:499 stop:1371 length:873 start_codon:yes stop_codon:yes gene_type:complete
MNEGNHLHNKLPDPKNIKAQIILDLDFYTEGPVFGEDGFLYYTDLAGEGIYCYQDGEPKLWAKGKRPNGQAIMANGDHLLCDSLTGRIVRYDHKGKLLGEVSPNRIDGVKITCPNDIAVHTDQGFFFTDSIRDNGHVYFVAWNGDAKVVATGIDFPNGIVYNIENHLLYIAESYKNRILKINLNLPSSSADYLTVMATLPYNDTNKETGNLPDGLAMDKDGRLWVAHYGMQAIQVLSEDGVLLASYDSGIPLTSNLCFGGGDLWVTGGFGEPGPGRLSRINIGIEGMPLN